MDVVLFKLFDFYGFWTVKRILARGYQLKTFAIANGIVAKVLITDEVVN